MDIRQIKKLIKLIEKSSISELEISEEKRTIRIIRLSSKTLFSEVCSSATKESKILSQIPNEQSNNNKTCNTEKEYVVRSPIVGVFYRSSHTGNKPFVSIGQSVNIGDTLCIIEAMKVMNHIQSDQSGIIKSILVNNEQPVEFDEPLLIIKIKQEHNVI